MARTYKQPELYDLLGPRFHDWHTASAIVMAESGGRSDARSPNPDGGENRGLFQIDTKTAAAYHLDPNRLFDPRYNAYAASVISKKGKNWHPWETWVTGKYRDFMSGAKLPEADSAGPLGIPVTDTKANPIPDATASLGDFLGKLDVLFDPGWWLRAGQVLLGIAALLLGVNYFSKEFFGVNPAKMAATAAVL